MNIPDLINLSFLSLPTVYVVYVLIVIFGLFIVWFESVRDGFDREKVFDIFFLSIGFLIGLYYLLDYLSFYDYYIEQNSGFILVAASFTFNLVIIKIFSQRWKWSIYRILDIFSFAYFLLVLAVFFKKVFLFGVTTDYIYLGVFCLVYISLFLARNKIFSGAVFSIFLLLVSIFGQFYYQNRHHLLFYFALITISMVNLVYRSKKTMKRNKLSFEFLAKIRGKLLSKFKRLEDEEKRLEEEDPYLAEGRDVGNAEEIDEAILEDRAKVEHDIKQKNVKRMQEQVQKALGRIDKGDYGICEVCGDPIDKARLKAYPEATKCVKCANRESA